MRLMSRRQADVGRRADLDPTLGEPRPAVSAPTPTARRRWPRIPDPTRNQLALIDVYM